MASVNDMPSAVCADDEVVYVDGPKGIALSLTPEAAADTSDRLSEAASMAAGQRCNATWIARESQSEFN